MLGLVDYDSDEESPQGAYSNYEQQAVSKPVIKQTVSQPSNINYPASSSLPDAALLFSSSVDSRLFT